MYDHRYKEIRVQSVVLLQSMDGRKVSEYLQVTYRWDTFRDPISVSVPNSIWCPGREVLEGQSTVPRLRSYLPVPYPLLRRLALETSQSPGTRTKYPSNGILIPEGPYVTYLSDRNDTIKWLSRGYKSETLVPSFRHRYLQGRVGPLTDPRRVSESVSPSSHECDGVVVTHLYKYPESKPKLKIKK